MLQVFSKKSEVLNGRSRDLIDIHFSKVSSFERPLVTPAVSLANR